MTAQTPQPPQVHEAGQPPCKDAGGWEPHTMVLVGTCKHRVKGAIHGYNAYVCSACGASGHEGPNSFACGPRIKAEPLTATTCAVIAHREQQAALARAEGQQP